MIFYKVWKLRRSRKRIKRAYAKDLRSAKSFDDRQSIEHSEHWETNQVDEEIAFIVTQRLVEQAQKLNIPLPSAEAWQTSRDLGISYLSTEVRLGLTQAIRKEQKESRDLHFGLWKDIILLLTGCHAALKSRKIHCEA
jgi:hypothetical protein